MTGPDTNRAFQRALNDGKLCPRCGRYFTGGLCPNAACSTPVATKGILGRRMTGQGWTPPVAPPPPLARPPMARWDVPLPPITPPPRPGRGGRAGMIAAIAVGVVVLLVAAVVAITSIHFTVIHQVATPSVAPSPAPTFPATWDPRVQAIVNFDQTERGLTFKHPVTVNFLSAEKYSAITRSGTLSKADQLSSKQDAGLYRALGMASGNVDPAANANTLADNGTLAFYDSHTKQVNVRGTDMTVGLRVTLAHELTHVLQDQYFDLGRIEKMKTQGEQTGYQTLYEGDAVRVEDAYLASLSTAEQTAYQNEQDAQSASSTGLDSVPPGLTTIFGAPYDLGPELLKVLLAQGGNAAVDGAFRSPPTSELQVFDPYVYLARQPVSSVPALVAGKGENEFDSGDFGAMSWYVVLSQRIDPHLALPAADAWGGDAYLSYTKNNKSCMRDVLAASTAAGVPALVSAFTAWAQAMPPGTVTITPKANGLELVTCDPGASANLTPVSTAADTLILPVARTEFTLGATSAGAPASVARCSGAKVAASYSEAELLDPASTMLATARSRAKLSALIAPCKA